MVVATQNPVEQEGTYPLPEAPMDPFLMHVYIISPDDESERGVIQSGCEPPGSVGERRSAVVCA